MPNSAKERFQEIHSHCYEKESYIPPIRVISSIRAVWPENYRYSNIAKNYPVVVFGYIIKGNISLIQDRKSYLINSNEIYISRKNKNVVQQTGPAGYAEKSNIVLEGPVLNVFMNTTNLQNIVHIKPSSPHIERRLFESIHLIMAEKKHDFIIEACSQAVQLLLSLSRHVSIAYPQNIAKAVDFIKRNLTRQLNLEELCSYCGISPTHLNRLFKQYLDTTPIHFFASQRMILAQNILTQSDLSVKEVAYSLGFDDPLYFSTAFKKYRGISPMQAKQL